MADPTVSVVVSTHLYGEDADQRMAMLTATLASLNAQTYPVKGLVVHNGPDTTGRCAWVVNEKSGLDWPIWATPENKGKWGNPWRLEGARKTGGKLISLANDDGYYAPVWAERLVSVINAGHDVAYCEMVYGCWKPGVRAYQHLVTCPKEGYIGTGCVLARRKLVLATPWTEYGHGGDGKWVEALTKNAESVGKCPECLYTEN